MATLDTILNIRVEGTNQMTKLKTAIDATSKELKELKKGAKAAGADQEKFNAKIITAETKLKGLRGELNKGKTDLIKNAKAAGDTSKSYDSLTKQNAALSASLRKLSDPLGKNRKEFDTLSKKIKTNTDTLKQMDAQMGRNQRNVGNYKQAIAGVVTAVGAAVIAFKTFQRVLGTFVEFEFQMKQVGVISGATADELLVLSDSAKELGATTAFTAGEVAGLQKELAKLGFDPTEIEQMTAATLDLAFAFGNDLDETATQVGVVLKSFKLEASETGRVTDVLAKAFASSALDLQKFSVSFPKVGAIANQVGFSLEGTTALLGALTDAGLEASTAGTSLRSIFLKLADSNSELSQTLGEGVNSVDTLLPALKDLFDSGIDVEEMLNLTDKRAVTAFATIASGVDDVSNLNTELVNAEGTAKEFADVMRDSLKGSLDEASSAANGFVINLLEKLAPAITFIVDSVALLFKGLGLLINNFGKVTLAVGAYGVVVAATAIANGTFTASLALTSKSIIKYIKNTRIAAVVTKAFSAALRTNPIGLLVGGLTLAVAALISFNSESKETVKGLGDINTESLALSDSLETMGNRYDELTSKTELSKEEQTELDKIIKDIAKNIPNAVTEVDKYGRALAVNTEKIEEFNKENGKIATLKAEINIKNQTAALSEQREELERVNKVNEEGNAVYVQNIGLVEKVNGLLQEVTLNTSKSGNVTRTANKLNKEQQLIYQEYIKGLEDGVSAIQKDIELNEDIIGSVTGIKTARQLEQEAIAESILKEEEEAKAKKKKLEQKEKEKQTIIKVRTAYEKLGDAVKANEDALKKAVTTNGNVEKATEDLRKSKEALAVVDDKLKKITDGFNESLEEEETSLQQLTKTTEENIALERKRLDILNLVSNESGDIATDRIKQSLKVAEVELDSALKIAEASDFVTDAQIQNIQKLRGEVVDYQKTLEGEEIKKTGFLQDALFGTDEDGEPLTGDDLLQIIGQTLNSTSEILGAFNALQNERLNTQLGVIEANSNAEVEAFKQSAEFEILTDEERTAKIEQIQKKHDDEMLKLKIAQFKSDQNVQIAQATISGATAVMNILRGEATGNVIADAIIKGILIATTVGTTALQIATIKAQAPPTAEFGGVMDDSFFAKGGMVHGNSHAQGGVKFGVGGRVAELEGGEAVINKRSTAMFKPMLSQMNVAGGGKKFADGGMVFGSDSLSDDSGLIDGLVGALNNQQVLLVESDVTNSQRNVKNIQSRITF